MQLAMADWGIKMQNRFMVCVSLCLPGCKLINDLLEYLQSCFELH